MSIAVRCILAAVAAYLIGSINFSIILSRFFIKKDIRDFGSGNAGSTNSLRVMGFKRGVFVIIGDVAKGVAAMLLAGPVMGEQTEGVMRLACVITGAAVVIGHAFPIYFGFRGGKGVMTTAAVILCIDWQIALIAIAVFAAIVLTTGFVSLGSMIAVWTVPVLFAIFYGVTAESLPFVLLGVFLGIFVTILHASNIKRLANGTENRFRFKKKK